MSGGHAANERTCRGDQYHIDDDGTVASNDDIVVHVTRHRVVRGQRGWRQQCGRRFGLRVLERKNGGTGLSDRSPRGPNRCGNERLGQKGSVGILRWANWHAAIALARPFKITSFGIGDYRGAHCGTVRGIDRGPVQGAR